MGAFKKKPQRMHGIRKPAVQERIRSKQITQFVPNRGLRNRHEGKKRGSEQ